MNNFALDVESTIDYYPFGQEMPGRVYSPGSYRFGMNGQMKDNEFTGQDGAHTTAQFWEYDSRIGRRWDRDPKPTIGISDYSCFANNPIWNSDPLGDWVKKEVTKYDKKGNVVDMVSWDKDRNESDGTNKIVDLSGPIYDTLFLGKLLIIDELDAKLHPLITAHIVNLFNNPKTNPNCAQLLFATHDTNLLNIDLFRRDQIWFTEKDEIEQTDLYSLYNINLPDGSKVRNDSNIEKNYIRGRYGAIPFITY